MSQRCVDQSPTKTTTSELGGNVHPGKLGSVKQLGSLRTEKSEKADKPIVNKSTEDTARSICSRRHARCDLRRRPGHLVSVTGTESRRALLESE